MERLAIRIRFAASLAVVSTLQQFQQWFSRILLIVQGLPANHANNAKEIITC